MTVQQPQGENCRFLRSFNVLCGHFAWVVLILRQFGRVSRFPRTAPGFAPVDGQRAKRNAPSPVGLFRPVTLCATVIYYSTRAPHLASLFSIFLKKKRAARLSPVLLFVHRRVFLIQPRNVLLIDPLFHVAAGLADVVRELDTEHTISLSTQRKSLPRTCPAGKPCLRNLLAAALWTLFGIFHTEHSPPVSVQSAQAYLWNWFFLCA